MQPKNWKPTNEDLVQMNAGLRKWIMNQDLGGGFKEPKCLP